MQDGSAPVATPAPSAGAATAPAVAAPTPSASTAERGDIADQIIDAEIAKYHAAKEAEQKAADAAKEAKKAAKAEKPVDGDETLKLPSEGDEEAESEKPEGEPPAEDEEKEEAKPKGDEELDEIIREAEIPKSWKETITAMKGVDPKVARQIRDEHYELTEYRRNMPLEIAKDIRGLFSSPDEAKAAQAAQQDIEAMNHALHNEPDKFLGYIADVNPDAFPGFVQAFPRWLAKNHPDVFRSDVAEPMVGHTLSKVSGLSETTGDPVWDDAVKVVKEGIAMLEQSGRPPEDDNPWKVRALKLEERIQQEDSQRERGEAVRFVSSVREEGTKVLRSEITQALNRLPLQAIPEGGRAEIQAKALDYIVSRVTGDRQFVNWVYAQAKGSGRSNPETRKQVIGKILGRARPLIGEAAVETLKWYRGITGPGTTRERDDTDTPVKEVGHGSAPGSRPKTPAKSWDSMSEKEKRDVKALSEDEIIRLAEAGQLRS